MIALALLAILTLAAALVAVRVATQARQNADAARDFAFDCLVILRAQEERRRVANEEARAKYRAKRGNGVDVYERRDPLPKVEPEAQS